MTSDCHVLFWSPILSWDAYKNKLVFVKICFVYNDFLLQCITNTSKRKGIISVIVFKFL